MLGLRSVTFQSRCHSLRTLSTTAPPKKTRSSRWILAALVAAPLVAYAVSDDVRQQVRTLHRFSRTTATMAAVALDYKRTWRQYPVGHPERNEQSSLVHQRSAEKVLELCQKSRGLYIKVGQYLASMNHILPKEWINTLKVLQDRAPFSDYETVQKIFKEEFGKLPEELFTEFASAPLASASLAQVHRARAKDGTLRAVKIQQPGLREDFNGDMMTQYVMLVIAGWLFPQFEMSWFHEEVRGNLEKELDFENEGRNAERCAHFFRNNNKVHVPTIDWSITSKRVLTMEYIDGFKITDTECIKKAGISAHEPVKLATEAMAEQIFLHGFVHCDPHPGNLFVRLTPGRRRTWLDRLFRRGPDFQLVILDHGLYRVMAPSTRSNYCHLWKALILQQDDKVMEYTAKMGVNPEYWEFLAGSLLMRPYKSKTSRMGSPHGNRLTKEELKLMHDQFHQNTEKVMDMLKQMPRELLLVLRNQNYLRALTQESPVNRFRIMARTALKGIEDDEGGLFERTRFEARLWWMDVTLALWLFIIGKSRLQAMMKEIDAAAIVTENNEVDVPASHLQLHASAPSGRS